jgi:thioester reductase-like protein
VIVPQNNPGSLIDPSLKLILQQIGFKNVRSLDELETLEIPAGRITGLPVLGEHGDLNIAAKLAYHIQLKHQSIICAADSNNISPELYQHLHDWFGPINVLFIGMECEGAPYSWAYGPLLPQSVPRSLAQTRRLNGSNADRAIQLVQQLQPEQVYVYAMGQEPWLTFITSIQYEPDSVPIQESDRLVQYCRAQGLRSDRLYGKHEIELAAQSSPRLVMPSPPIPTEPTPITMQPITDLLFQLQGLDVQLHFDRTTPEPTLRCNAPKGALSEILKLELKSRKAEIIAFLSNRSSGIPEAARMLADSELNPKFQPAQGVTTNATPQILLTGATGFVGAFLLAELLNRTAASIHCLVRAEDDRAAWRHLQASLTQYGLWQENYRSRLTIHWGDLAQPDLGLDAIVFAQLAAQIDTIYHNGAWVHHLLPYKTLSATNVLSTNSIIALASQGSRKTIHHISSSSVFTTAGKTGMIAETDLLDTEHLPKTGYAQTKWVSERLMEQARDRGFDVQIFRLGGISGHSQTGRFNANDFLYRLLIGVVRLGSYPIDRTMPLRVLPIDYVVKAIVQLAQSAANRGATHHLIHPHPVDASIMFQQLEARYDHLKRLSYADWRSTLLEIAQTNPDHPLYALVALLPKTVSDAFAASTDGASLEFATDRTQAALGMPPPMIAAPLIDVYINHLVEQKLMPPSPALNALYS